MHEELPQYDLPISVVAEYTLPPLSSGKGVRRYDLEEKNTEMPKPIMDVTPKMAMADQNYRTSEYHALVRDLIELHRPIVKTNIIMVCPVCDRSWQVLDDRTRYLVCSFWARANNMGLVIMNERGQFSMNVSDGSAIDTSSIVYNVVNLEGKSCDCRRCV